MGKDFKGSKALVVINGKDPQGALNAITELIGQVGDVNWTLQTRQPALPSTSGKGRDWSTTPSAMQSGSKGGKGRSSWQRSSSNVGSITSLPDVKTDEQKAQDQRDLE